MRLRLLLGVGLALVIAVAVVSAADLDGKAIVEKMAKQNESQSAETTAKMILIDKNGRERVREIKMRTKEKNGLRHTVTTFLAPPDVRGTKFLIVEQKNADDDQRLFLPALKKVKRITSSNKSGNFMGSTFAYADLQTHDPDQGAHQRLADAVLDGQDCYVVETVPQNLDDEIYSKLVYWVRKDNFLPIKGEFYDKKGKLWKRLEVSGVEKRSDGTWVAKDTKMSDLLKGASTILRLEEYEVDVEIDDAYFTERFLTDETLE